MRVSVLIFLWALSSVASGKPEGLVPLPLCASYCLVTVEALGVVTFHSTWCFPGGQGFFVPFAQITERRYF